jgi:hypothetical protein
MCLNRFSGLPVVEENDKLVGILAERDVLRYLFPSIKDIMTDGMGSIDFESMEAEYKKVLPLKAAGRDKIEATIITEFYRVMGKRLGITTDDMAKKYGLDIKAVDEGKTVDGEGVLNQDERGRIRIKGNNKFTIELLKTADKSTFFHESGHYFLEILKDVNSMESANQEIKDDFKSIMDWLGVNSPEDITTEHHEKWARGFEAYLREGKAPSNKLRKAFNTFKVWLTSVYKRVSQLNVELSDDVRGVMDRMLATEQEISEAESRSGFEPLFKDPVGMGMNQKQAESYIESVGKVALEARESFQKNLEKAVERQVLERPRKKDLRAGLK